MKTSRTLTTSHLAHSLVLAGIAFILTLAILSPATYAATVTWSGGGGNGSWTTGANWAGTAPVSGDTLTFSGTSQTITINDLAAGTTYGGINFTNDGSAGKTGNFTLSGNSINPGSGAQDIVTTATTSGTLTDIISLTMNLTASKIIKVGAGHNLIISGNILNASGSRSLTKSGTASTGGGMLTLSGNNTYTGGTTISAGTLQIGNANALGTTGNITFSGGALQYGSGITVDLSGRIKNSASAMFIDTNGQSVSLNSVLDSSNSAGLTKTGSGTLTLNASNTYTGNSTISAGILQIGNANALGTSGNITFGGGALQYGSGITVDLSGRIKNSGSAMSIDTNGQSVTFASILDSSNSGGLTKNGSGTLTLNASNTYTGATTINAGTLSIAAITNGGVAGALGNSTNAAANLVLGGGTLLYTGSNGSTDRNFTLSNATTSVIDVSSAGTTLTISGTATTTTGGLTKNGSGTLLLAGSNNYTGDTTVNSGILQIGANNRISDSSTLRVNGGTFNMATFNDTVAGVILSANGTISGTNPILTSTSDFILENGTAAAILAGTVGVNKTTSGTVTLSAANTYSGATTINAGTLQIGNGGTTGALSSSSAITNNGTLVFNRSNAITQGTNFASGISGTGNVTQAGTGTLTFNGTNSYTGTTTISAGTLALNSSASNNSTISGNILINGGTLNYGSAISDQISNSATVTLSSGSFALVNRDETIGTIAMSGGALSMTSGVLTLSSDAGFTGGTISMTVAGGSIVTAGQTTLGNVTFSYSNASNATKGLIFSSGLIVDANTTANFTNASTGVGRISLEGSTQVFDVGASANMNIGWALASTNSSGALTKNGTGTLTLSAANTYTGTTTVNAGTVSLNNVNALQNSTLDTGTSGSQALAFSVAGANTYNIGAIQGGDTLDFGNNTISVGANNAATSFTGTLAGSGGNLTKVGSGAFTLSGNNSYTGTTTISGGTIRLGNAVSNNSTISGDILINGGTLNYATTVNDQISNSATVTLSSGSFVLANRDETIGAIAMSGGALSMSSGILTLSSNAGFTGGTISMTVAGGSIITTGQTTLGNATFSYSNASNASKGLILLSGLAVDADTTANFTNASTGLGRISLEGSTQVFDIGASANMNIGWAVVSSNSSGGLTKNGTGTMTLSAANTFSGTATINQGTLSLGNLNALQNSTLDTGISGSQAVTFGVAGANTYNIGAIQGGDTLDFGSNTISVGANNATTSFTGILAGSGGSLIKVGSGSLTLSGANTYTGSTTISAGTLVLNGTNSNSAITVNSGGTLAGSGTGGATTINSGGKIGPGNSPGMLTVGNLTLNGGATYSWEMADATGAAGTGWDQINATGLLTIGSNATSTFTIAITSSGNPSNWIYTTSNQSWDIIDYGTINGFNASYFTLNTSAFQGDLDAQSSAWALTDTGSTLRLTYTYTANTPTYTGGTGNWSTGFSPAITTGGNATFAGLGGTATNDIASATLSSIGGLTFDGINSYTLGANSGSAGYNSASALAIGGGVTNNSIVTQTINVATSFAANQTISGNTGSLVFGGNVAVAANATLTMLGNSSTTISGVVSGAGALTKNSNSTLTLSGNNTYSGGTTITTGTVLVGHDKAFGTGILRLGGTIASTDGTDRTISNNVGGLSGTWSYTFGQANGGTGNLTFTDTGTATFASTGSKTFNVLNTTSFASSLISTGNVTVTKIGAGTLILTGNSTYSGSTTINAGTLQIGNGGTSGGLSASGTITNNGTLVFKRSNTLTQGTDFANSISGTGNLTQAGSGTLVLGSTNTYTGATTISAGTLSLSTVTALSATSGVNLANSTTLAYTGSAATLDRLISVTSGTGTIRNSGSGLLTLSGGLSKNGTTLTLAGGSNGITVSNAISGSSANSDLVIDGGTVNLTGTNTYNGPTSLVNGATLSANITNALPTANGRSAISIDATGTGSSTLALGASQSIASLTGNTTSTVTLGSNTLTLGTTSGNTTYAGRITGSSSSALVKDGASTQVLTGNNSGFTGTTTISSGTLTAASAGAMGNSTVINVTGGSFLVTAENAVNDNTAINLGGGRMAVSGTFNETVGALTLSANSTLDFSGFVGTLRFSGIGSWATGANLAIWNWSGTTYWGTQVNNYATPSNLVFSNNSTLTSNLANISFYSDSGNSFVGSGFEVSGFSGGGSQIIAVPETETYFYAVALLAGLVIQYLRRRAKRKLLQGHRPA
jgi:autotransporter-associated beta strand protein